MDNNSILSLENIFFAYENQVILDNIKLNIEHGDFLAILGPNGSGKTTLLKIILGLLRPISGNVNLFGYDINTFSDFSKIGYVPQKATQFDHRFPATVEEIISSSFYGQKTFLKRLTKKNKLDISRSLQIVGLTEHRKKLINTLSGGQQQKVFIARALANNPQLLILDEPTIGLDCQSQQGLYDFLEYLNKELNITLITVSHDIGVICSKVSKVACLNKRLLFHGRAKDFLEKDISLLYGNPVVSVIHHA